MNEGQSRVCIICEPVSQRASHGMGSTKKQNNLHNLTVQKKLHFAGKPNSEKIETCAKLLSMSIFKVVFNVKVVSNGYFFQK